MHKLSPSYLQKPAYGAMPLEPAETRPRVESSFSKVQSTKLNTDETILMAGTGYSDETAVQFKFRNPKAYVQSIGYTSL